MPAQPPRRARRLSAGLITAAVLAVAGALAAPALATVTGPDVSSYQHDASIDWSSVKSAGQSFVFIKATEGSSYTNPYFAGDWAASHTAGLIHGAYHFARPSVGSAVSQADRFIAVAGLAHDPGDLPPTLDLETTGGLTVSQLVRWTKNFLAEVQTLTGRTPTIYTYPYFWQQSMGNSSAFTSDRLWIASYGTSAPTTLTWSTWTFWQYSSTSSVSGITGQVDMNTFNGTLTRLQRLANIATTTTATPTPTTSVTPSPTVSPTTTVSPVPTQTPVATVSPTPSTSPTPTRPVVHAYLSPTVIKLGQSATMWGRLAPYRSGQLVYRQGYYDGAWHTWATTRVSTTGHYRFTIKPTVRAVNTYRIYVPATKTLLSAKSGRFTLTVK